jgi:hypothetical protein
VLRTEVFNQLHPNVLNRLKEHNLFRFFVDATDITKLGEEPSEERQELMIQRIGRDLEIARLITEEIIPYALEYFLGLRGQFSPTKEADLLPLPLSEDEA